MATSAIAVSLLFAFANADARAAASRRSSRSASPASRSSVSHRAAPVWREHERTHDDDRRRVPRRRCRAGSPARSRRVSRSAASSGPVSIMKSNGGRMLARRGRATQSVQTVLSGLAGGHRRRPLLSASPPARATSSPSTWAARARTSASCATARSSTCPTSSSSSGCRSRPRRSTWCTLGAGGGSIAWVDDGGLLRVGPRSAGAVPGPACYGLGRRRSRR